MRPDEQRLLGACENNSSVGFDADLVLPYMQSRVLLLGIRYQISDFRLSILGIRYYVLGIRYLVGAAREMWNIQGSQ